MPAENAKFFRYLVLSPFVLGLSDTFNHTFTNSWTFFCLLVLQILTLLVNISFHRVSATGIHSMPKRDVNFPGHPVTSYLGLSCVLMMNDETNLPLTCDFPGLWYLNPNGYFYFALFPSNDLAFLKNIKRVKLLQRQNMYITNSVEMNR